MPTVATILAKCTGYWKLGDGGIGAADHTQSDSTSNGLTLASGGSNIVVVAGKVGNGVQLPGDGQILSVSAPPNSGSATKLSFMAWIKQDSAGEYPLVSKSNNTTETGFDFEVYNGLFNLFVADDGESAPHASGTTLIAANTWTHVAIVYDGTQTGNANRLRAYINGVQDTLDFAGSTIPAQVPMDATTLKIGIDDSGGAFFAGIIDELAYAQNVFDAADIAFHYNSGAGVVMTAAVSKAVLLSAFGSGFGF